jgi:[ribosomal protein S5]-alanine N-acetyltransferase
MLPSTERLIFRRWSEVDFDLARSLWRNAEVMHYLGGPMSDEKLKARVLREIENDARYGFEYWPIFLREGDAHVGVCGLKPYRPEERQYEIGFQILPQFWRRGYAYEAARAVVDFAFRTMNADALFAGHHPDNGASRALLERLGFECIGTHFFEPTGLDHPWYRLRS